MYCKNEISIVNIALFILAFTIDPVVAKNPSFCDFRDFDKSEPKAIFNSTRATNRTHLMWASDVDRWEHDSKIDKVQHILQNLHDYNLSLVWEKAGILVPYYNPIHKNECRGASEFGPIGAFVKDFNSPILTPNDGEKAATAYVRKKNGSQTDENNSPRKPENNTDSSDEKARVTGTEIIASYEKEDGTISTSNLYFFATYYFNDETVTISSTSGDQGETIAFSPNSFGIEIEHAISIFEEHDVLIDVFEGNKLLKEGNSFDSRFFQRYSEDTYLKVKFTHDTEGFYFENVKKEKFAKTPIIFYSPKGRILMAKTVSLADFN
ncbi:hypothetical protein [Roseibium sp.]|uniref:hypothetical protein n=1 Tax=Roseibium sp. TaxID=1936156 RepID=UPI003B517495